ncbi:MAG TPA: DUF4383 domain-containing protein [Gemmatimonadaceae bacterium]|jgi:hypothetical protein
MTTSVQRAAMIFGWILIALGILGFVTSPDGMSPDPDTAARVFGIFPINIIRSVLHLTLGIWGLASSQWDYSSRQFARVGGVIFVALAIYGIFSPSFAGLFPIGGNDVWLDGIIGALLAYFGFTAPARATA